MKKHNSGIESVLPLRGRWLRYFLTGIAVLCSPFCCCMGLWLPFRSTNRDPAHLKQVAELPNEAIVVSGREEIMLNGYYTELRLTLPNTRTAQQWLYVVAKRVLKGNPARFRRSATEYNDWNGEDGFRVRYLGRDDQGRHLYDVVFGWG